MGFNAWRNLGAFALAGVALVGCTNTPQRNTGAFGGTARTAPPPPAPTPSGFTSQPTATTGVQPTGAFANQNNFAPTGQSLGAQRSTLGAAPAMQQPNPSANTSLTTPAFSPTPQGGMPVGGVPQMPPNPTTMPGGPNSFGTGSPSPSSSFTPGPLPPAPGAVDVPQPPNYRP